jgi:hypothetical protein
MGRAGHSVMRDVVEKVLDELPDLAPYMQRYGIEDQAEEFKENCAKALHQWRTLRPIMGQTFRLERKTPALLLEGVGRSLTQKFVLQGTPDVVGCRPGHVDLVDWKFGYLEHVRRWAVQGLAYLACEMFGVPEAASGGSGHDPYAGSVCSGTFTVVLAPESSRETWEASDNEVQTWLNEFRRDVLAHYGEYQPGNHCFICRRAALEPTDEVYCPHGFKAAGLFMRALTDGNLPVLRPEMPMMASTVVGLLDMARTVEAKAKEFVERVRELVLMQPGQRLPLGEGEYLGFKTSMRREVKPLVGLPILLEYAPSEVIEPAVKVSKSAAVAVIKAHREADGQERKRGWKKALEMEIEDRLTAADALVAKPVMTLGVYREEAALPAGSTEAKQGANHVPVHND